MIRPWEIEEVMKQLIDMDMSQSEIAEELGCTQSTVSTWINRHDIEYQNKDSRKGIK